MTGEGVADPWKVTRVEGVGKGSGGVRTGPSLVRHVEGLERMKKGPEYEVKCSESGAATSGAQACEYCGPVACVDS